MKFPYLFDIILLLSFTKVISQNYSNSCNVEFNSIRLSKIPTIDLLDDAVIIKFVIKDSKNITGYKVEIKEDNSSEFKVLGFITARGNSCYPIEYSLEEYINSDKIKVIKLSEINMGYQRIDEIATIRQAEKNHFLEVMDKN